MQLEIKKKRGISLWWFRFQHDGRNIKGWLQSPDVMSKRQAIAETNKLKANLTLENSGWEANPKKTPIKEIFDDYSAYLKEHKPSTYKNYKYLIPDFRFFYGKDKITFQDIQDFQKKRLADGVEGQTVNRQLALARAAVNRGIRVTKKWKEENPFTYWDKHPENERDRYLSKEELVALLLAAKKVSSSNTTHNNHNPCIYDIVVLGILTGKRKQEILKLHKNDIDLDAQVIIKRSTGTNKYKKAKYTPIPKEAMDIITERIRESRGGYLFENKLTRKPYNDIRRSFGTALRLAGIEDFRFHDLRHTFATYVYLVTNDQRGLQMLLGHSNIQQTSKYTHIFSEQKKDIVERTSTFISGLVVQKVVQNDLVEP